MCREDWGTITIVVHVELVMVSGRSYSYNLEKSNLSLIFLSEMVVCIDLSHFSFGLMGFIRVRVLLLRMRAMIYQLLPLLRFNIIGSVLSVCIRSIAYTKICGSSRGIERWLSKPMLWMTVIIANCVDDTVVTVVAADHILSVSVNSESAGVS